MYPPDGQDGRATGPALKAPFPWFGGKSRAAAFVWAAFGDPAIYVEPFCGSAAVLLARPPSNRPRNEIINDKDGFVANFWRAMAANPEAVAGAADWIVSEVDLTARHLWLMAQKADLFNRLHVDPDFYDARAAGYWAWGASCWIGGGWCRGTGAWGVNNGRLEKSEAGVITRQVPALTVMGVNTAQRPDMLVWFSRLQARLRTVKVVCGDWRRVVTEAVIGPGAAVFLDPPYGEGDVEYSAGNHGAGGHLSAEVREWCIENGDRQGLQIALCGHTGEHDCLLDRGWTLQTWARKGGYARTAEARARNAWEAIWFSPGCLRPSERQPALF